MTRPVRFFAVPATLFFAFVIFDTAQVRTAAAPQALTCGGLEVTIVGTQGDDVIDGTNGNDVIAGLAGNDTIRGGDGEDVICGGPGDDYIEGQGDEDILFGDEGDDTLDGGEAGCCIVFTNTGDDVLSGGPGNDVLHTSDFPQAGCSLYGDQGDDTLFVWQSGLAIGARAFADGGNGNDTIYQYTGDALLIGGNGDDLIVDWDDDGAHNETITMTAGNGDDELVSEDATSTVDMDGEKGVDVCQDGDTTASCEIVI
jgi:Ca2+-binding RTX toxin-like protein